MTSSPIRSSEQNRSRSLIRLATWLLCLVPLLTTPPLLLADDEPDRELDPRGIPYAAIDAEPSLGKIVAHNPEYGFAVARLTRPESVKPGLRVALRRTGVIVTFAYVETIDDGRLAILQFLPERKLLHHPLSIPALGDEIIRVPRPVLRP